MYLPKSRLLPIVAVLIAAVLVAGLFIDQPLTALMARADPQIRGIAERVTWFGRSTSYLVVLATAVIALTLRARVERSPSRKAMLQWWAGAALFIWLSVAASGLLTDLIKLMVGRARPAVEAGGFAPFTFGYAQNSFPSGHSTVGFALAFAVAALWPRWFWPMLAFAVAIAASRVILQVHYLSDVTGGALVALVTVNALCVLFARRGLLFGRPGSPSAPARTGITPQ
jgi:membrane-associated phospholipid phosphatase